MHSSTFVSALIALISLTTTSAGPLYLRQESHDAAAPAIDLSTTSPAPFTPNPNPSNTNAADASLATAAAPGRGNGRGRNRGDEKSAGEISDGFVTTNVFTATYTFPELTATFVAIVQEGRKRVRTTVTEINPASTVTEVLTQTVTQEGNIVLVTSESFIGDPEVPDETQGALPVETGVGDGTETTTTTDDLKPTDTPTADGRRGGDRKVTKEAKTVTSTVFVDVSPTGSDQSFTRSGNSDSGSDSNNEMSDAPAPTMISIVTLTKSLEPVVVDTEVQGIATSLTIIPVELALSTITLGKFGATGTGTGIMIGTGTAGSL